MYKIINRMYERRFATCSMLIGNSSTSWSTVLIEAHNSFSLKQSCPAGITTYRNGPRRTGTDRNGPERTETDRNGPKRTFVDTETDFLGTETDFSSETDRNGPERTETDRNGPKRTFVDTETDLLGTETDFSGYRNGLFWYKS